MIGEGGGPKSSKIDQKSTFLDVFGPPPGGGSGGGGRGGVKKSRFAKLILYEKVLGKMTKNSLSRGGVREIDFFGHFFDDFYAAGVREMIKNDVFFWSFLTIFDQFWSIFL